MALFWSNIDWFPTLATTVGMMVAFLFTAVQGGSENGGALGRVLKPALWSNWTLAVLAAVGVALVGAAATFDDDGLFGEVTAAWVQAVGSIAAIGAAIWIEQGSQRRAREDRLQQRRVAIRQRGMATAMAQSAFKHAAADVGEMPLSMEPQPFPERGHQALVIARELLEVLLNHPSDLSEDMLTALATCRRIVARVEGTVPAGLTIPTEEARNFVVEQLKAQEEAIKYYRSKVPDWGELVD